MKTYPSRFILTVLSTLLVAGCVSRAEIEALSDEQFEQMQTQMPLTSSAAEKAYVYCVSRAIISQLGDPYNSMDWEIEVFDNEMVNAFAMAGGKIGVFNGIFAVAVNQDQLAAVIGHEVAHVTEEHSLERANQQLITGNIVDLGAAAIGGDIGQMVAMGADIGLFLPYGRAQESEADVVGLEYMAGAGFDPRASVQLWKNMDEKGGAGPPQFLSTHPSAENRIGDLIGELPETLPLYNEAIAAGKRPNCRVPNS
jgi:predicted Zn-dependent protease